MKWIFLLFLIGLVPALTVWLRQNPARAPIIWASLGFIPFVQGPWNLYIAPISWPLWPGYVKGLEVSILDAVALAVLISRAGRGRRVPLKSVWIAYILACALSISQTEVSQAAFFYVWQLGRAFLVFAAVASICDDERGPEALIKGMAAGLVMQAGYAVSDRLGGRLQASGTFGHQNLLGMITHFAAYPALAMLMAGGRGWAPKVAPLAAIVIVVLTASRATIGFAAVGFAATLILSSARRWTGRKGAVLAFGCIAMAAVAPVAMASLNQRFAAAPLSDSYDEREAFEKAALMISADHPMGVGANTYVVIANTGGYSARAGVIWNAGSRETNVHNTYLLVLAETGYIGLASFILLLATGLVTAFRWAWKKRRDPRGDLMLGLGVTLAVVAAHLNYEWIFVTFHAQYMFAITMGLIAGLAREMARKQAPRSRPRAPRAAAVDGMGLPAHPR